MTCALNVAFRLCVLSSEVLFYYPGVAKLRLFEPLHGLFELSVKLYICSLFVIYTAQCRNIVTWYCGS